MFEHAILLLTGIGVVGVACQWIAWRFKLPAILLLLLAGLGLGPFSGVVQPDRLFGHLLFPLVSLGVAVVLFEGSLNLKFHQIRGVAEVVRNLITVGVLVTWIVGALAAHWLMAFPWTLALLFGALVVVTGPTVIVPMLRTIRPTANIANVLRWEGILIDPIGAVLAVLIYEFIVSGQEGDTALTFLQTIVGGTGVGLAAAWSLAYVLRRHLLPHFLVNVVTLVFVLAAFTAANAVQQESGLLAVTVMGVFLANVEELPMGEVIDFKESLSVMIISGLFIILAARVEAAQLWRLGWPAVAVLGVMLFVARPAAVLICALGSKLSWRERAVVAWVAPRGIVAAAISALFALRLGDLELAGVDLLVPLTFLIIIGTVVVQGLTARPLATFLQVAEPEPNGVLIAGAHSVARAIGQVLMEKKFRVLVADTDWDNIRAARMEGLPTYFGNIVSEHAERTLDLMGIGRLLAMTPRPAFNALACVNYRNEFGGDKVYAIKTPEEDSQSEKSAIARQYTCERLFGADVTVATLARLLEEGGEIRTTRLTENFDFSAYRKKYKDQAIALFALNERGCLRVFTADDEMTPAPGWSVVSLLAADVLKQTPEGPRERKSKVRKVEHSDPAHDKPGA